MALAPPREYVVITSDQIYYCNTKDNPGCVIDTDGFYYPNLSVVRQFSGARNKQYVLLSAVNMRRGVTGSGYHIFQLAPKSKNPRGYVVYSLGVGDYYAEEADPCAELPAEAEATLIRSVDILHEGTKTVTLAFTEDVTNCSSGVAGVRTLTFSVVDGLFKPASGKAPR
jgi:hypothetical protein